MYRNDAFVCIFDSAWDLQCCNMMQECTVWSINISQKSICHDSSVSAKDFPRNATQMPRAFLNMVQVPYRLWGCAHFIHKACRWSWLFDMVCSCCNLLTFGRVALSTFCLWFWGPIWRDLIVMLVAQHDTAPSLKCRSAIWCPCLWACGVSRFVKSGLQISRCAPAKIRKSTLLAGFASLKCLHQMHGLRERMKKACVWQIGQAKSKRSRLLL